MQNRLRQTRGIGWAVVLGAAVATLSAAGCGQREAEGPSTTTVVTTPPPASTTTMTTVPATDGVPSRTDNTNAGPGNATGTDTATADMIRTTIVRNPQMTGSRVTPVVVDGIATLNGFVQNAQQKGLAGKAARDTAGVMSVKNKLEIRPTGGVGKAPPPPPAAPKTTVIVVPGENRPTETAPPPGPAPGSAPGATPETGGTTTATGTPPANPPAPAPPAGGGQ